MALVVKRGEHGAMLFLRDGAIFWTPAYPLEKVQDPTGAGDAFAGGFVGHLSVTGSCGPDELRRAVVHGVVCGSFAVEGFSIDGLEAATPDAIEGRYRGLRAIVAVGAESVAEAGLPPRS
jgi:sugar/nucleoside kinase (ribokinase family)